MPEQLDHLIQRLREMDYSAWSKIDTVIREHLIMTPSGPDHLVDWIISGCIQDAIAADDRFLGFEIEFYSYFDVKYEATIFWDGTGSISVSGYGETAADAILAAYILALEAEHGGE